MGEIYFLRFESALNVNSWFNYQGLLYHLFASSSVIDFLTRMNVFSQDRGSIYTGSEYISTVLKSNCRLSHSRRGEPGDNAVNESFFSRFKEEKRDEFYEARSFEELEKMVRKAIDCYNQDRYHSSIGLQAPIDFTKMQVGYLAINQL
jgi:transposase InsO family protein